MSLLGVLFLVGLALAGIALGVMIMRAVIEMIEQRAWAFLAFLVGACLMLITLAIAKVTA